MGTRLRPWWPPLPAEPHPANPVSQAVEDTCPLEEEQAIRARGRHLLMMTMMIGTCLMRIGRGSTGSHTSQNMTKLSLRSRENFSRRETTRLTSTPNWARVQSSPRTQRQPMQGGIIAMSATVLSKIPSTSWTTLTAKTSKRFGNVNESGTVYGGSGQSQIRSKQKEARGET